MVRATPYPGAPNGDLPAYQIRSKSLRQICVGHDTDVHSSVMFAKPFTTSDDLSFSLGWWWSWSEVRVAVHICLACQERRIGDGSGRKLEAWMTQMSGNWLPHVEASSDGWWGLFHKKVFVHNSLTANTLMLKISFHFASLTWNVHNRPVDFFMVQPSGR